ncbi:MAG: LytTR family transcriptional regulator [Clostridia bacterium]|nr:LytTR family transcriptional regulator [Clostridia bacterium]
MKYSLIIDPKKEEAITAILHSHSKLSDEIEALIEKYYPCDCLSATDGDEEIKIPFDKIECITVLDRKTFIIDERGRRLRINSNLKELEGALPSFFIRINKSSLANRRRILSFKASFSGGIDALFACGYSEYVSRRCYADIKRSLKK